MKNNALFAFFLLVTSYSLPLLAADMNKVLKVAFPSPETGFDPAKMSDVYSTAIIENIFDPLLTYDYLARPIKLIPNTLSAMPTVSADGKTFTFSIKPGIYFAEDPVFQGKKRELTAEDYAYSLKRFADPKVSSSNAISLTNYIAGLYEASQTTGPFDYDAPIAGIQVLDRYRLQIILKKTNYHFLYTLATPATGVVAREIIEAYSKNTNAHPVGTGPYQLREWQPGNRIKLAANPNFRAMTLQTPSDNDASHQAINTELPAKTLPAIGNIEISIIEEEQPLWLSFLNQQIDISGIPASAIPDSIQIDPQNPYSVRLKPTLYDRGIRLHHVLQMDRTYTYFNMRDPVVGGYEKEKIALRRAIAMAYPTNEVIARLYRGQAIPMQNLVPPGMNGNNPQLQSAAPFDPDLANALLDQFGYQIDSSGYRQRPEGQPLLIEIASSPGEINREFDEIWLKTLASLKIKVSFKVAKWNEQLKAAYAGKLQIWSLGGVASIPDGDDFVIDLWSKTIGEGNFSFFQNADYDQAYEASTLLPDGDERNRLFDRMNRIASLYHPYIFGTTRFANSVNHDYIENHHPHPLMLTTWRYLDSTKTNN